MLVCSCGTLGTVKYSISTEKFERENLPLREIDVVVLATNDKKLPNIRRLIGEASEALRVQTGVSLREKDVKIIEWQSGNQTEMLAQVAQTMQDCQISYDLAIAFHDFTLPELLAYAIIGKWEGLIDRTFRRYIIIRRMDVQVLLHEICHAFIFSTVHSWGLMAPAAIYLAPGTMALNRSIYLSKKDREEVLRNKWRNFAQIPNLENVSLSDRSPASFSR